MKTLKTLQQGYDGYRPKAGDEQKFKDKHTVKHSHKLSKPTEDDDMFKAANVKVSSREPGHGYDAGEDEEVYEEAEQIYAKKTLGEMMEAMKLKDPVGVELHFTSNDPELKPYRVIHFTAKNAHDEEKRAPKGYKVKRKLVYGKAGT